MRVPEASSVLVEQVAATVQRLRVLDVQKPPGIAEAIDWVRSLRLLGLDSLDAAGADATLGSVLKYREDQELVRREGLQQLVDG
jgi:MoxR-like ATPase